MAESLFVERDSERDFILIESQQRVAARPLAPPPALFYLVAQQLAQRRIEGVSANVLNQRGEIRRAAARRFSDLPNDQPRRVDDFPTADNGVQNAPNHIAAPHVAAVRVGNGVRKIPKRVHVEHKRIGTSVHGRRETGRGAGFDDGSEHLSAARNFGQSRRHFREGVSASRVRVGGFVPERRL